MLAALAFVGAFLVFLFLTSLQVPDPMADGARATASLDNETFAPTGQGDAVAAVPAETRRALLALATADGDYLGWRGQVVDADGGNVPGATVHLAGAAAPLSTVADAAGRFAMPWPGSDPDAFGTLFAQVEGRASLAVSTRPAQPARELRLQVLAGVSLAIRLHDEFTGASVAGVPVRVGGRDPAGSEWMGLGVSGADGRAAFHGLASSTAIVAVPANPVAGLEHRVEHALSAAGGDEVAVAVRRHASRLWLTARDAESGEPLPRATYSVLQRGPDGGWSLGATLPARRGGLDHSVLAQDRPMQVRVAADGYLPRDVNVRAEQTEELQVDLHRASEQLAQVLVGGRPAGPATLHWSFQPARWDWPDRSAAERLAPVVSGSVASALDGRARLPLLGSGAGQPEELVLRIEGPDGIVRDFGSLETGQIPEVAGHWQLEIAPAVAHVVFELVDQDGFPQAGVVVDGRAAPPPGQELPPLARTGTLHRDARAGGSRFQVTTGPNGRAEALLFAPADLLWAAGEDDARTGGRVDPPLEPGERRELRLVIPASKLAIAGRVFRADGQPADWTAGRVFALPVARLVSELREAAIGADGHFRFGNTLPGRWQVWVVREHAVSERLEVEAGREDLRLELQPTQPLLVRVFDARTGAVVAGAQVLLVGTAHESSLGTSAEGTARVDALPAVFPILRVRAEGYAAWADALESAIAAAGAAGELEVRLEPGRNVSVALADSPLRRQVRWVLRADLAAAHPLQHQRAFAAGSSTWFEPNAPTRTFQLQAYDQGMAPIGAPQVIPESAEDFELLWNLDEPPR